MNNNGIIDRFWLWSAMAYCVSLLVATHIPIRWIWPETGILEWDKMIHFAAYGLLTGLFFRAIQPDPLFLRWMAIAAGLMILAAIDELTQYMAGRQTCLLDFSADVIGILAVFVYDVSHRLSRRKRGTTPKSNTS